LLIAFVCLTALATGVILGALCVRHPLETVRAWNLSSTFLGLATEPPPPDTGPGWHGGEWVPPTDIPAQPNWTWHTSDGKTYENVVITSVSPTDVTITHSEGIAHILLDSLPPDVQHDLHYIPSGAANPPASPDSLSPIATLVNNKLINSAGQAVATPGPSIKYYAIYYSAGWCPPCHAFTPKLVDWYRKFKPFHHDFELIFVSEDKSEMDMYNYMQEMQMPWPAIKYAELPRQDGTFRGPDIQQFAGSGIPDLVLVDSSGKVLSDSFDGTNYLGPQAVVDYMNDKLGMN
jgi:nucleoredoxin